MSLSFANRSFHPSVGRRYGERPRLRDGVAIACLFSVMGCQPTTVAPVTQAKGAAAAAPAPVRVKVVTATQETVRITTSQPGRIEAFEETPLYSKVAGYIEAVPVDIGDRVKSKDVLVRVLAPELLDDLKQKEALRDQADAEIKQSEAAVRAAEAALVTAEAKKRESEAGIARAEADHKRWKAEHARITELAEGGSVTRKLLDETLNSFRAAEAARSEASARVESAGAGVAEAKANVEKSEADVIAARAKRKVADANVDRAATLAGYLEIKAPFDGCVTHRNVLTGHYVQPVSGGTSKPLMVVAVTDRVRIFIDVPEADAQYADRDDRATVTVQALGGQKIEGKVARTSWALDTANRSLRVEIDLDNREGRLRPGMYATAEIVLEEKVSAVTVPTSAVAREGTSAYVFSVQNEKVARRAVVTGIRSGNRIEIREGVEPSETIVVSDVSSLKDGEPVQVIPAEGQ